MSFFFSLYRAAASAPPLLSWEANLAQPIGTSADVRRRVADLLPQLHWSDRTEIGFSAHTRGQVDECISIYLREFEPDTVSMLSTDASPSVLRLLMSEFQLNFCCAEESGEMRDPFSVGDRWL